MEEITKKESGHPKLYVYNRCERERTVTEREANGWDNNLGLIFSYRGGKYIYNTVGPQVQVLRHHGTPSAVHTLLVSTSQDALKEIYESDTFMFLEFDERLNIALCELFPKTKKLFEVTNDDDKG